MNDFLYNNLRATAHGSLAQLDRATHYECVGRGFESLKAHQKAWSINRSRLISFLNH